MAGTGRTVRETSIQSAPMPRSEGAILIGPSLALFRALDAAGVRYCHFKSNEHLAKGLAGITDLDVLLDRRQARMAQTALLQTGFKRFASRMSFAYPGVEDYFGFDAGSGRLLHVHLHYALVVGEPHLKSYQLRMAEEILATRRRDAVTGVQVADPNSEMVLLLIRCALKLRWRERLLSLFGRRCFRGPVLREYHWLLERIDQERVCQRAERTIGPKAAAAVRRLLLAPLPTIGGLWRLRSRARAAFADQRTHGRAAAFLLRLAREAAWLFSSVNRRVLRLPVAARRSNPIGGFIVTFLGPDGSGKSTLAREVRGWLGPNLDVYPAYFGSGKGPVSAWRWPLKVAFGIHRRLRSRSSWDDDGRDERIGSVRWIWALALALEKQSRMKSVVRARNRGMVVICDRYPQVQVEGFNDGPLLTGWLGRGGWRRRIARWELEAYHATCLNAPDLAIKLNASLELAMARRPEKPAAEIRRRLEALERIDYGERCDHVVIDVERPLDEVLAEVKRTIWDRL